MKKLLLGALLLLSSIAPSQTLLYSENFGPHSCIGTMSFPVESYQCYQSQTSSYSGDALVRTGTTGMGFYPSSGYDSTYPNASGERYVLFVPGQTLSISNISISSYSSMHISFGFLNAEWTSPDKINIEYKVDNGSWLPLSFNFTSSGWNLINIPNQPINGYLLTIRFSSNSVQYLCIDDISITGNTLSSHQNQFSSLSIYPNPSSDNFYLSTDTQKLVRIFNISGKMVFNKKVTSELEASSLTPGVYICEIIEDDKKIIKKLIRN